MATNTIATVDIVMTTTQTTHRDETAVDATDTAHDRRVETMSSTTTHDARARVTKQVIVVVIAIGGQAILAMSAIDDTAIGIQILVVLAQMQTQP